MEMLVKLIQYLIENNSNDIQLAMKGVSTVFEMSADISNVRYQYFWRCCAMITDSKCFQIKKHELCSKLLMSNLLEVLFKEKIINFATYEKVQKEMRKYE